MQALLYDPDAAQGLRVGEAPEPQPSVGWRGSWDRASEAVALLLGRHVRAKPVLEVAR